MWPTRVAAVGAQSPQVASGGHCQSSRTPSPEPSASLQYSRRHPIAHPSLGIFILPVIHFPLPAQYCQCYWLQALQGDSMGRQLLPPDRVPAWYCHQLANQELIPKVGVRIQHRGATLARAAHWAAVGTCSAELLSQMFIRAGHLFSSSSCGTGLLEGICPCKPAKFWGKTVQNWLKHGVLSQPMPFLYCSVLSLSFLFNVNASE